MFIARCIRNLSRVQLCRTSIVKAIDDPMKCFRYFSLNSKLYFKMFMEHENSYAYNIMKNNGYKLNSIEKVKVSSSIEAEQFHKLLDQNWANVPSEEIFRLFPKFGAYALENKLCISNKMFDTYIDNLTDRLMDASDEQLVSVFYSLCQWPETVSVRTRNFIEVWAALDETCCQRQNNWSMENILSFLQLFYMLNISKGSDFVSKSLNKLASKAKKLTPDQLVQTLFFVGIQRKSPYDIHNLEVHLYNNFDKFHLDELAIMSMGFFKSKTPLRSLELVKEILQRLIENTKSIHEVSLAAFLKVVRYSMKVPDEEGLKLLIKLLDQLKLEIPRLSLMCNVHIAILGTSKLVFHEDCLDSIAEFVDQNISKARIKDLERLILTYGTFDYTPKIGEVFFEKILEELRKPERNTEILEHSRSFACCMSYFVILNKFPEDLINKVLSEEFLLHTYGKNHFMYGREILVLGNITEIYFKDKDIIRLPEKVFKALSKKYTDYMPSADYKKQFNITERMMIDMSNILTEMRGGPEFHLGDHIITHHQRGDYILCNSPDGTPLPIPEEHFSSKTFGFVRRPPDDNLWIALIIVGRNGIIQNTGKPTGQFLSKERNLQQLGYLTNFVPWDIFSNLQTKEDKISYLTEIINVAVNESRS